MKKLLACLIILLAISVRSTIAQPALWKHSCNCGRMEMMVLDTNQNVYVFSDGSGGIGIPSMTKLSRAGAQLFNNTYLPSGYTIMQFNNSFYFNGYIYIAANVSNSTQFNNLYLLKVDTLGGLVDQLVIDTVETTRLVGIKSQPYFSYGFHIDQSNNIHISFLKNNSGLSIYSFLKFDTDFNLIAQYHDTVGFLAYPGPSFYLPDGTVYYSTGGVISKLNSAYTAKVWTAPLYNPFAAPQMLDVENGEVFVLTTQSSGVNDPVNALTRILDLGSIYIYSYDTIIAEGPSLYYSQMLVDLSSNAVYVAGNYSAFPPYRHYLTKYNSITGGVVWKDSLYDNQLVSDLLLSPQKNVIAVGGGSNYYAWFYNAQGTVNNIFVYNGPCGASDFVYAARLDSSDKLILTGSACESASTVNWGVTLKYNIPVITTGLTEGQVTSPLSIAPSPASTEVNIQSDEIINSVLAIDITGRSFFLSMDAENRIDVSMIPAGIYQLIASSDKHIYKGKLLIAR